MTQEHFSQSQILIVHDGRVSHLNTALAIGEILEQQFKSTYQLLRIPHRLGTLGMGMFKRLSWFPALFQAAANLIFGTAPAHLSQYRLIVCSGMSNLLYSAYLSQQFHIPLVYSGDIQNFNEHLIHWTITALSQPTQVEQIILPTPPVRRKFTQLQAQPHCGEAILLLGGPTDEYPFSPADYLDIIRHFDHFVQSHAAQGYVVCSAHTPAFNAQIRRYLNASALELIGTDLPVPLERLLARSKYIFVTEDRLAMLSEAIQSGRIVHSICLDPAQSHPLIKKYLHNHLLQRQAANQPFHTEEHFPFIADLDLRRPIGSHFRDYLLFDRRYAPHDLRRKYA